MTGFTEWHIPPWSVISDRISHELVAGGKKRAWDAGESWNEENQLLWRGTFPDQVDFQPSHRNHLDYWHDSRLLQRRALLHCVKAECCLFWFSLGLNPKRIFTLEICPRGGRYLGEMVRFCKEELDIESVTVVTNGSKVVSQETHPP